MWNRQQLCTLYTVQQMHTQSFTIPQFPKIGLTHKNSPQWSRQLSQPTLLRASEAKLTGASSKGGKCAESPPTFIWGKRRKNRKRCGLRPLSVKGLGVVFTHGEGISTPHVRPPRRQPLIECENMTLFFMFPFYVFISFIPFLYFSLFVVDKGVSLCSYVFLNCDEEIRPT